MKAFLRYYLELPYPIRQIDDVICRLPGDWLDQAAREANLRGIFILHAGTLGQPAAPAAEQVSVVMSRPHPEHGLIRRSIQWIAPRGDDMVDVLRGDLELAELGAARTHLALSAQYRSASQESSRDDRMQAQRVGESTLKAFVDRLAGYIEAVLRDADIKSAAVVVDARQQPPLRRHLAAS